MTTPTPAVTPELRQVLRRHKLGKMLDTLPERITLAKHNKLGHAAFLELVLADEIDRRDRTGATQRARTAGLDAAMTLEAWQDHDQVAYDHDMLAELATLRFVEDRQCAFVLGPVGVGKTHLAHALGHVACRRRIRPTPNAPTGCNPPPTSPAARAHHVASLRPRECRPCTAGTETHEGRECGYEEGPSVPTALRRLLASLMLLAVGWFAAADAGAASPSPTVLVARVDGPITPVTADYLSDGLEEAERAGHQAMLVEMDTPGGLDTSMRRIVQAFLDADVPVVVYVAPSGARAASAGALIAFSAHVVVMAPGTTIGAATPVDLQGGEISDKIINDAAAFAESVAAQRGRNTDFAIDAVRRGRAASADEARTLQVVDLIAPDRRALLAALDGRTVTLDEATTVTLDTANAPVENYDLGLFRQLLQFVADPNVAFLFLAIGTLALMYEVASPGIGFGGIIGAILLVLGFFALSVLPVNVAGIALLLLAAGLFVAELFTPGVGVFAAGGSVALVLAGLFLFEGSLGVSPAVLWPTAAVVGGGALLAGRLAWRARRVPPVTGSDLLVGRETVIRSALDQTTGQVLMQGAWWTARTDDGEPLHKGQKVRVVALNNLTLIVEPVPPEESP